MPDELIDDILSRLDNEIAHAPPLNGIKMSIELYEALIKREKLKPIEIDMVLWKWMAPGYAGRPVYPDMLLEGLKFEVGQAASK